MFLLLTLNNFHFFRVSIVDFKEVNASRGARSCVNIITQSLFSSSKDEQMLYLTSFKIAQIFQTSKISKYFTASSSSTDLHEKGSAFPPILPRLTIL